MTYNAKKKKTLYRYISGKKFLTPERFGKKFSNEINKITHTPLPHKRLMVMSTI